MECIAIFEIKMTNCPNSWSIYYNLQTRYQGAGSVWQHQPYKIP
uniref:Uncharacterized protein n=1 Tax=Nelumbo nucifera TaxID=4432 RepID=A0A822Z4A7_NELNU|nr:TPA_asm: hypothetical protein HUJ06_008900 [Nelumbo nucifera]